MDFVFGTLANDTLKLLDHRVTRSGLQHGYVMNPLDPNPGDAVTLTVTVGQDITMQHVACYYTTDDTIPAGSRGVATNGQVIRLEETALQWDTLVWGYIRYFQGVIPAQAEGTIVRYIISAWTEDGNEIYADTPDVKSTVEHGASAFFRKLPLPETYFPAHSPTIFGYHVDTFTTPQWARESVIYHVFVDRFYPGDDREWLQPDDLLGFFGGTLWGVRDKLDYIADFGATCIWLSPIFVSESHHGYDALDYRQVEPRLGGEDALRALVTAAHEQGIRILLDFACNHIAREHPIFQDALNNPDSPYRAWFTFDDSEIGYRTFFGVADMPELNVRHPDAKAWMIDIAQYWLREFDIDGYRLDYAQGCGQAFWSDFRAGCRAIKRDCWIFGELVEAPGEQRKYVGRLDGALDFHTEDALRKTFGWGTMSESAYARFIERHQAFFPDGFLMPTFLDNHDMDRFLYIVNGDKSKLRRAAEAQMQLPNPPIIYYGTEVGLSQDNGKDDGLGLEVSRQPMLWGDNQDRDLLDFYKTLISKRKTDAPD